MRRRRTSLASLIWAARYVDPPWSGCSFFISARCARPISVGARPRLHAKDLIGLLLRHFAAPRRPARSPLPHHPARAHASRAPGGQDTQPVARGSPASISGEQAEQRRQIERVERRALVAAGEDRAAHRAAVVVEFHLDERRAHPRHLARRLLRALKQSRWRRTAPSRAGPGRTGRAGSRPRPARGKPGTPRPPPRRCRRPAAATCTSIFGSALRIGVERPQHQDQHDNAENQRRHGYLNCCQQLHGAARCARLEIGQRLHAARRIGRDRPQQFGELMRRADDRSGNRRRATAARSRGTPARRSRRRPPGT